MEKLYRKHHKTGLSASFIRHINRNAQSLDPITKTLVKESKIDLNAILPEPTFSFDRILLFTALLIANHPGVTSAILAIRKKLNIIKLWEYKKHFDHETDSLINTSLNGMPEETVKSVDHELEIFFNTIGRNLSKQDWANEIATYIFTGVLPLPIYSLDSFQLVENETGLNIPKRYPAIIIKKRIKKQELDQLIEFIRENERRIIKATQNLPSEPVKRLDVDLTKLAIGLWIYKNEAIGNKDMEDWIQKKEKDDGNYFGKYKDLGKEEFPNFKSDAITYLNQLYPLK